MTEIVFRALSTLKVLSACRFPTLINSVKSLQGAVWRFHQTTKKKKITNCGKTAVRKVEVQV